MANQYAVIHVEKHTGAGKGALDRHIDRAHIPENADPKMTLFNRQVVRLQQQDGTYRLYTKPLWEQKDGSITERVNRRITEGYRSKKAIRKDAVRRLDVILTGSHDVMCAIKDEKLLSKWAFDNYRFLQQEYGKSNIVSFAIHLDETTPHVHATVVPLTTDGRLSAKELVGDKKKLELLQDKYAEAMKPYQMQRGQRNNHAHHNDTKEFYRQINTAVTTVETDISEVPQIEQPPVAFNLFTESRSDYQNREQKRIGDFATKLSQNLKEKEFKVLSIQKENDRLKSQIWAQKMEKVTERNKKILASRLNSQEVIKQQRPKQGRGL
jgi:hypothetical protein